MLDLTTLRPVVGSGLTQRAGRPKGPNPFLDNGWLNESYQEGRDYEVTVPGALESYVNRKGEDAQRWTGAVAEVRKLLRAAAEELGIGVSIQVEPATRKNGSPIDGSYVVKYLAKERSVRRSKDDLDEDEQDDAED